MRYLTAFLSGALFSIGLAVSGMIKPSKVIGFMDVTGDWDTSLGFVMGGALLVFAPSYRWVLSKNERPLYETKFDSSPRRGITWQLTIGSAVFGVGWAIAGFCPATAFTSLPALSHNAIGVVVGMMAGIIVMRSARKYLAPSMPVTVADF